MSLSEGGVGTITRTDEHLDVTEDIDTGHDDSDFSGWFCLSTNPFPCPAPGCTFVAMYMTAAHLIIVFPRKDDERLLDLGRLGVQYKRNPKVVEYEVSMGPCISYDEYEARGRPIHGKLSAPP